MNANVIKAIAIAAVVLVMLAMLALAGVFVLRGENPAGSAVAALISYVAILLTLLVGVVNQVFTIQQQQNMQAAQQDIKATQQDIQGKINGHLAQHVEQAKQDAIAQVQQAPPEPHA